MAGVGFGIDATRCRPALDPADRRRGPNIESRAASRAGWLGLVTAGGNVIGDAL